MQPLAQPPAPRRIATIVEVPWSDPVADALRSRQRAEIAAAYGRDDSEPGAAPSAADIDVFLVARAPDGDPVGCGALRALGDGTGEVKRMYVEPGWRGSGAAGRILAALEERARALGWTALRLETGDRLTAAVRFYARAGYARIPNYGPYADAAESLCFEKPLT